MSKEKLFPETTQAMSFSIKLRSFLTQGIQELRKLRIHYFDRNRFQFNSYPMKVVNWLYLTMGTEHGKSSVTTAHIAGQYFRTQKWIGLYLMALMFFFSGALTSLM